MNAGKKLKGNIVRRLLCACLCAVVAAGSGAGPSAVSTAASMKVKLHRYGTCVECGTKRGDGRNDWKIISYDDKIGKTSYRWVTYTDPVTGKKKKTDAYCLQPLKAGPEEGSHSAVLINSSQTDKQRKLAALLYFADGGPGSGELKAYLSRHSGTFPDFQTAKGRFALMHMMLSYVVDPDEAFRITEACGEPSLAVNGHHRQAFQKQVKKICAWCIEQAVFVDDPGFEISPQNGKADYIPADNIYETEEFSVSGADPRQYFNYTVPEKASLAVDSEGEESVYRSGETAEIHVGDRFQFTLDGDRDGGIVTTDVAGELARVLPYRIKSSGRQDMGFYAGSQPATASFSVSLVRGGDDPKPENPENPDPQEQDWPLTHTLKVTKTVAGGQAPAGQSFPFHIDLSGLGGGRYYAVVPGQASARIRSDSAGNIRVTVTGSDYFGTGTGDLQGIPVKIIRSDGKERTLLTDAGGRISSDRYLSWLQGVTGNNSYTIEFLRHRYRESW